MAEKKPQTFANHGRYDPLYHFFVLPVFLMLAVAAMTERTLNEKLSRSDIKKAIQTWRPDYWRV
jgi:Family of unknown function (DUF6526)